MFGYLECYMKKATVDPQSNADNIEIEIIKVMFANVQIIKMLHELQNKLKEYYN